MINIGAEDYNVLKQQYIKKYIRLELLDFQYNIVDELSGNMTKCSINVDSNSDLRRSCDLGFVVTTSTFDIKAGSKLWLDKFVRPYVGYENMRTGEIQWYNQGIYLVNNPQWSYNASTNEISMQALDLMSKLTGLRNGNLEGIPTKIAKDENVREAIISTLALGGFTKYICEECKTKDGTIVPVPYDIEIDVGGTIYDILTGLRDIMPNYQIYFDINGVFHYEPIPLAYDDPVLIDDDLFRNVLISENINTDFESVKNYVEVLGHTWDVDYYSPSDKTTVSGGTITPTFADLTSLEDGTAVGITLPSNATAVQILPDGYTQLEYIQSNGGAHYIDTGFKPNQNTGIIAKFQLLSSTGNQTPIFSRTSRNVASFGVFIDSNSRWTADYGTLRYTNNSIGAQTLINLNFDKNVVKFNNDSYTFDAQTFQGSSNLTIFGMNTGGTVANNARMNFYSCEIYDNGTLIRSFIPCKNPSGTIGLYDIVNSKFYTNVGSGGTFTAGPEVEKSTGITINYLGNNKIVDIDNEQIQKLTKDTEWIFQYVIQTEGEGESATETKFWRFMGHQQAQATSYDNNPSSPFYVGDPIGSSSVGRIRIVLYGGEYDNIYSDDLAQQRADFEIYQRSRLNDSISMETIPIPWMDANIVISHRFGQKQEPSKYIVKSFSVDYATGGTMTINAITWYPYYEESEVV